MNLNQVTIKSQDVDRATNFYLKLGLKLIVDSSPRYVRLALPCGESTLSISAAEGNCETSTIMYFEVDDLNLTYHQLTAQGVKFKTAPQEQRWLWHEASLKDPDGHPLILFNAGKNRKEPPWKVSVKRWFEYLGEAPFNLMK